MKHFYVYIMTNHTRRIYTGVTNDLRRRVHEHKSGQVRGFTSKYQINQLIYFEETNNIESAISREKQIKSWARKRKIDLIESANPGWAELSLDSEPEDSSLRSE